MKNTLKIVLTVIAILGIVQVCSSLSQEPSLGDRIRDGIEKYKRQCEEVCDVRL